MLLRIKPACRFSFHYTFQRCHVLLQITRSPTLLFFQRCHMLLQITRSPTLLFFCSFLWLFLSYTRDFISLRVTDSHLPQSVFPGEFPRRKLNYLLIRRLAVKNRICRWAARPAKTVSCCFFVVLVPLFQVYDWSR